MWGCRLLGRLLTGHVLVLLYPWWVIVHISGIKCTTPSSSITQDARCWNPIYKCMYTTGQSYGINNIYALRCLLLYSHENNRDGHLPRFKDNPSVHKHPHLLELISLRSATRPGMVEQRERHAKDLWSRGGKATTKNTHILDVAGSFQLNSNASLCAYMIMPLHQTLWHRPKRGYDV